jgi:hypothetical protein
MSDALLTYMADHLAGSIHAIELLKHLQSEYSDHELGRFAKGILVEVESDRHVLEQLAQQLGGGPSTAKEAGAWAGEKLSRLKLRQGQPESLGTFEALESLALGILGKLALWRALAVASAHEPRLRTLDYEELARRASVQHEAVERKRINLAAAALRTEKSQ